MTLGDLLAGLAERGLHVDVRGDRAAVRGGSLTEELRAGLAEHRGHVVRLFRPRQTRWGLELAAAEPAVQEYWACLACAYDAQGLHPRMSEFLAWRELQGAPNPELETPNSEPRT